MGSVRWPLRWPTQPGLPCGRPWGLRRASSRPASKCRRHQRPPWGLLQVRYARPLGARVHAAAIPVIPAITATVAAGTGPRAGPAGAPSGWVLRTGGPNPVHGIQHRPHIQRPRAAPLPLRVVQWYALVVPPLPLPRWVIAAPAAAAGPSAGPPTSSPFARGGVPPPARRTTAPG